jgi:hypothetical protein
VARQVALDAAKPEAFVITGGQGILVNGAQGRTSDLMTEEQFGGMRRDLSQVDQ